MTRRALVTVAALASVLTLGLAPTAAHAGPPANDKAIDQCKKIKGEEECNY